MIIDFPSIPPLLRYLGITLKQPFDWGSEPQADLEPNANTPTPNLTGLDSLVQFVLDDTSDDGDAGVKQVLASMRKEASVPLDSSDAEQTRSTCSNKKQYLIC